ncbi:FAD-binding 9 siderophore-interacting domain protein [Kribbella flavida DSM 17836]|uniref:FAD-binding 9 siderophore-interacting domain protein n=1 Tax=Kribbella flavida (strain DSM 17836 / JCM 10339 / NBRC 14399) TaxID=479435 RepID=D2Q0Z5_KRIFD|nr:siderophore-interacting protein [Kribbella flavida]ADB35696.1 FAD-binding 9 siderophore-interacting domain protein [Kribbella flavida DSM 17836]
MTTVLERPITFDSVLVTVAAIDDLSPHLRRVTFVAPELADVVVAGPDQRIKVLLTPPDGSDLRLPSGPDWYTEWCATPENERFVMRTYTVRAVRPEVCELDIEFVLHGVNGPASAWVSDAQPGDQVGLIVPFAVDTTSVKGLLHSGVDYVPPADSLRRVLVADETALPALASILEQLPPSVHATVFVEVPDLRDIRALPTPGTADITWIAHTGAPADSPKSLLEALESATLPHGVDYAWVAGESTMIKSVRRHLVDTGLPKSTISFQGYWKRGEPQV